MNNSHPFIKCLRPKRVTNKYTGDSVLAKCGKCSACLNAKALNLTNKCKIESESHKYTYFVTLTYSDDYLPLVRYDFNYNTEEWELILNTPRLGKSDVIDTLDIYQSDMIVYYTQRIGRGRDIPFLCKKDVQLFIKRLRKRIINEKVRYFLCGEYGPLHYRPHYHMLLWFEEEQTAENLHRYISESWQYGRIDVQVAREKCASYVASYVNGSCSLPPVYSHPLLRPFNVHSRRLAEELVVDCYSKKQPEEFTDKGPLSVSVPIGNGFTDCILWRSLTSFLMPKCKGFSYRSDDFNVFSYRTYEKVFHWTRETQPFRQAVFIYDTISKYKYIYSTLTKEQDDVIAYFLQTLNFDISINDIIDDSPWTTDMLRFQKDKLIMSIYRDLSISKRFCELLQIYMTDSFTLYNKIKSFYSVCDSFVYKSQIEAFNKYIKDNDCDMSFINYLYCTTFDEDTFINEDFYLCYKSDSDFLFSSKNKYKRVNDRSHRIKH